MRPAANFYRSTAPGCSVWPPPFSPLLFFLRNNHIRKPVNLAAPNHSGANVLEACAGLDEFDFDCTWSLFSPSFSLSPLLSTASGFWGGMATRKTRRALEDAQPRPPPMKPRHSRIVCFPPPFFLGQAGSTVAAKLAKLIDGQRSTKSLPFPRPPSFLLFFFFFFALPPAGIGSRVVEVPQNSGRLRAYRS